MPATVSYMDDTGRRLTIRVRHGYGPIPVDYCFSVTVGQESDVNTGTKVTGLTFSEKGLLFIVGFDKKQKDKQKKDKQKKDKQKKERQEHLFPVANVEWIEREGDWE